MTPIRIDVYGKIYTGCYDYEHKDLLRVSSVGLGSKVRQIGNTPPESVARMLLRELVLEAQKKESSA